MTLVEFSAWFEGFIENLTGPPNDKQWERIKTRVKEIDSKPITQTHFINHYWPSYGTPYVSPWGYMTSVGSSIGGGGAFGSGYNICYQPDGNTQQSFNSTTAMHNLGQVEAQQMLPVADAINQ